MLNHLLGILKLDQRWTLRVFLALSLVALLSGAVPALAATPTFSDDFETGNLDAWNTSFIEAGNAVEVTAPAAKNGNYGLRISAGGTNDDASIAAKIPKTKVLYSRVHMKLVSGMTVGESNPQMFFTAASTSQSGHIAALALRMSTTGGAPNLYTFAGGSYANSGFEVLAGAWYCVETAVIVDSSAGSLRVWVNGASIVNLQNLNTGTKDISWLRIGTDGAKVASEYAFDGFVNATDSSVGCTTVNGAPNAYDDVVSTNIDTPIVIDVLANDFEPNGDAMSIAGLTTPTIGTASVNAAGTVLYTPVAGFTGTATFTYTATDGVLTSPPATVTVVVSAQAQANPYQSHVSTSTGDPSTEATITWKTPVSGASYARMGSSPGAYAPSVQGVELSYPDVNTGGTVCCIQAVAFTGLTPSTAYYYQVGSDAAGWSLEYSFSTAPSKGTRSPFTFVAMGDQSGGAESDFKKPRAVSASMIADNPVLVAGLGDIWQNCLDQACVDNYWNDIVGDLASQRYFMAAAGNHSHFDPDDLITWTSRLSYPDRALGDICTIVGDRCPRNDLPELWYSFDWDNVHFTVINLGESHFKPFSGSEAIQPGEARYEWFKNDLANAASDPDTDWQVVLTHFSLYGQGKDEGHASDDEARVVLGPLAEQYGVDVWLAGHQAVYERTLPVADDGNTIDTVACGVAPYSVCTNPSHPTYITIGTGGDRVEQDALSTCGEAVNCDQWVAASVLDTFGHARINVDGTSMQVEFVDIDGAVHDSVTINGPNLPAPDSAPPVISAVDAIPASGGATVVWTTDEPSTSQVAFGTTAALGSLSTVDSALVTDHVVVLSGLTELTTYSYQPLSVDAAGNSGTGTIGTFTTPTEGVTELAVSADAHIDSAAPNSNYGTSPSLAFAKNSSREIRALFNFVGLPAAGTPVDSAELNVYVSNEAMEADDVWFVQGARVLPAWDENTVTWNNQPTPEPVTGGTTLPEVTTGTWVHLDVTQSVLAAIAAGDSAVSLLLTVEKIAGDGGLDEVSVRSGNYGDPALRPSLTLVAGATVPLTAPTAGSVSVTGAQDTTIAWTPVVSDPNGDPITCAIGTGPTNGAATVALDCASGTYTPTAGYFGTDAFTYVASDGALTSPAAAVSVTVTEVLPPTAPTAGSVAVTGAQDTTIAWAPVVADANGDALTCAIGTAPANGTAAVALDCSSGTYTPTAGYFGADSFTYIASDGALSSTAAVVSVTVTEVLPPSAFLFSTGFESGDLSDWTASMVEAGNSLSASTVAAASGAYGLQSVSGGSNDDGWLAAAIDDSTDVYVKVKIKVAQDVGVGNHQMFLAAATSQAASYTGVLAVRSASSSSTNRLTFYAGGGYHYTDVYLQTNTWYCVEMRIGVDSAAGEAQVWVDGVLAADLQGINTGSTPVSWVRLGTDSAAVTSEYHFDDIAVSDGARAGC